MHVPCMCSSTVFAVCKIAAAAVFWNITYTIVGVFAWVGACTATHLRMLMNVNRKCGFLSGRAHVYGTSYGHTEAEDAENMSFTIVSGRSSKCGKCVV